MALRATGIVPLLIAHRSQSDQPSPPPGIWRVAFAFDPARSAIPLVAGDKRGVSQGKFYKALIDRADQRFDHHLAVLKDEG